MYVCMYNYTYEQYMQLSEQKPDMFTQKTEIHFILPVYSYVRTLNDHEYSLPPLANVDWSAFPECFLLIM